MKQDLLYAFTSLFVAMNLFGILPLFMKLTADADIHVKKKIVYVSGIVAFFLGLSFALLGQHVFDLMGITTNDFKIGGGILLFTIALTDLMSKDQSERKIVSTDIAIVPVATPLIVGPAVLTTLVILTAKLPIFMVLCCFIANLSIVLICFLASSFLARTLGRGASRAIAKISSILLLAISVAMVRVGITNLLS